jgi:tetratricopeptide (TPR) repeat protein
LRPLKIFSISIVLALCACGGVRTGEKVQDYADDIRNLNIRINNNPDDFDAKRDLSIILVRTNQNDKAKLYLTSAEKQNPDDPAILFYSGLNNEFLNQKDKALDYYSMYQSVSGESEYREMMKGRYQWLSRDLIYEEMQQRISQEKQLKVEALSPNTIAVFPLLYKGLDKSVAPLSRGLSEMISIDLGKVKKLTILERVRLQALKDELALSQSPKVDPSTAPRLGKLLAAGQILSGTFDVSSEDNLTVTLGSWDVNSSQRHDWINNSGDLKYFFRIEKELVFNYIDQLGIDLTQQERKEIEFIPTQNLESFMLYCQGLQMEDAGQYNKATSFFQQAAVLDPSFKTASDKAQNSSAVNYSGGNKERFLAVTEIDISTPDKIDERLDIIEGGVRSGFIPGTDNRKPAEETSIAIDISNLPEPPPPPPQ